MLSIGLVLGAGGVVGSAYHAGSLAALADQTGWDPRRATVIVGTSAGSGIGATLRAGLPVIDQFNRVVGRPISPDTSRRIEGMPSLQLPAPQEVSLRPAPASPTMVARSILRRGRVRPGVALAGGLPRGRVPTDVVATRVNWLHDQHWPTDALWICAVELGSGQRVVFGRNRHDADVGTAVAASSAIPGFFAPVAVGRQEFVDGGTHSPTNLDLTADLHLDLVVAVSPMSATRSAQGRDLSSLNRGLHARTLAGEVRRVRQAGTPVLVLQPTRSDRAVMGDQLMDPDRMAATAEQAYLSVAGKLARDDSRQAVEILRAAVR
ncbi:MAG: hypothetical protein GY929_11975 [Actinomycetia bacterium]|nr:hypothetical protein [Actinomycetes bacterium]